MIWNDMANAPKDQLIAIDADEWTDGAGKTQDGPKAAEWDEEAQRWQFVERIEPEQSHTPRLDEQGKPMFLDPQLDDDGMPIEGTGEPLMDEVEHGHGDTFWTDAPKGWMTVGDWLDVDD